MYVESDKLGGPIITAISSGVSAGAPLLGQLFAGKAHYSPWGFLYDDYPLKIYEAETQIVQLNNAIADIVGGQKMAMPPAATKTGGTQYQASMQAIVPKYAPGTEQQIATYNRVLNEAGGGYEVAYGKQLALIQQLQAQYASLTGGRAPVPSFAPGIPSTPSYPYAPYTPGSPLQPSFQPAMPLQAGFDMRTITPWLVGGIGLMFVVSMLADSRKGVSDVPRRHVRTNANGIRSTR